MLRRTWWGVVLVLLGVAAPAQAQVKLEWKFKKGETYYVENKTDLKQTIDVMGMSVKQDMTNTTLASFAVKDVSESNVVLEQKILDVKVKSSGGLGGGADKMTEKMKGAVFTITMSPNGKISKFEGYEDLIKRIAAENEEAGKLVKLMLTEETMKKGAEEAFGFLPNKAVDKGEKWKSSLTVPMGPIGTFKAENSYTYQGKSADGDEIAVAASMTYMPPKGDGGDLPFKVVKGDLKSEGAKGTIIFDREKGRMVRYTMNMVLKGSLTMEVQGNQIQMDMVQDQKSTIRVLDKPPSE